MNLPRILLIGLALSLAANAYLLLRSSRGGWVARNPGRADNPSSAARGAATPGVGGTVETGPTESANTSGVVRWRGDYSAAALRQLTADLKAAGLPHHAVREAVEALISRHTRAASDFAKLPFWQQGYGGPRFRAEAEKMDAARRELIKEVLGADEANVSDLDPISRNVHFGNLPPEKIAALFKLERDYSEITREQYRGADGSRTADTAEGRLRLRLIEEERMRDIAAALSPEEFKAWEMRSSRAARNVIQGAKNIDLSDAEYAALLDIQRSYEASIPTTAGVDETTAYLRGWAAPLEQLRTVLPDDRLYAYLEATDPLYGAAAKFSQTAALPRAQTEQLYRLQLEAVTALSQAAGAMRPADFANTPAGQAALASFHLRLEALLGPERAATYRQTVVPKLFAGQR